MSTQEDPFVQYYAEASTSPATAERFRAVYDLVRRVRAQLGYEDRPLDVADVGCGAGTQCLMWAKDGHNVNGIDINEALVGIAKQRAQASGGKLSFTAGSATALPWADASMDVCLVPELLEHVTDWKSVMNESLRVLRPGGVLYVSTSNYLCPKQMEFDLPMYSWYPAPLKRYFEKRAVTDWPELANHAKYPAVHWFSFYSLRRYLGPRGFNCHDRFDVMDMSGRSTLVRAVVGLIRALPPMRFLGHMATSYTMVLAIRR